jgi:DNA gyrase subunit B
MQALIEKDHIYIAQPPLYKIKKGRFEQYIKDDREFVKVMVKRASEGMVVRHGETASRIEGAELTRFMATLNEYLGFVEKVDKRIRNEKLTEMLARAELMHRADFASKNGGDVPERLAALHAQLLELADEFQIKVDKPVEDEEHHTWSLCFKDAQGRKRCIDWTLASSPEFRQMMAKYSLIKEFLEPPFLIEYARGEFTKSDLNKAAFEAAETGIPRADKNNLLDVELEEEDDSETTGELNRSIDVGTLKKPAGKYLREPMEKQTARGLFAYIVEQGKKDYQVQRYKGLGEMTATQLWETTMDPEHRTLLRVRLEDIFETDAIFTTLMGEDVEARRKFIEDNALDVKNLDI